MEISQIPPVMTNTQSFGKLRVSVTSELTYTPIPDATINIAYAGQTNAIEQLKTDVSGQSETIELTTPPAEYSLEPEGIQPYSEYTLTISAPNYETAIINNTQLLSGETAIQPVQLMPLQTVSDDIVIPAHTLYGTYPPKIPEAEIKPITESGEIVLSRVVIPETIVVHTGPPNDAGAKNYYVPY